MIIDGGLYGVGKLEWFREWVVSFLSKLLVSFVDIGVSFRTVCV